MSPKLPFSFKYWLKRLHFLAKLDIWLGDLQEFCAKFAMDDENIQQMGCCLRETIPVSGGGGRAGGI